jgi:hypothetical protein
MRSVHPGSERMPVLLDRYIGSEFEAVEQR